MESYRTGVLDCGICLIRVSRNRRSRRRVGGISTITAFIRLSRPHFLVGGALLYGLGAVASGVVSLPRYLAGQAMVSFSQLTAHFVNEWADVEADRRVQHRTLFSGGSGVLTDGAISMRTALGAAGLTSLLTVASGIWLVALDRPVTATVGMLTLVVSWLYSAPPVRLLGTGWGELATSIVVTVMVPVMGATAQGVDVRPGLWSAVAVLFPIHMAMMLAFELPDLETDAAAGKRVLAVRIGRRTTERTIGALLGVAAIALVAVPVEGAPAVGGASVLLMAAAVILLAARRRWFGVVTATAVATLAAGTIALMAALAR